MNALVESFLTNGGKATFIESLGSDTLNDRNILLLGGFVEEFASVLQQKGIDLNTLESTKKQAFLLHPVHFNPYPHLSHFLYEVGCEEVVVALLVDMFYPLCEESLELKTFVQSLDIGNLTSECNLSEEELEQIAKSFTTQKSVIVLGKDLSTHRRAHNIGNILALLSKSLKQVEIVFLDSMFQTIKETKAQQTIELEELECYDGLVAYLQRKTITEPILEVSKQFHQVSKIQEEIAVKVQFVQSQKEMKVKLYSKSGLKGLVGILWIPQIFNFKDYGLSDGFCYQKVKISKVA